jgi:mannose-6-phosphate isomerase-like protein (cupin superfamily)
MSSDESDTDPMVVADTVRAEAMREYAVLGVAPSEWSNGPGARYRLHRHTYRKILYCLHGTITFHLGDGDVVMRAGDRLDLPAGTDHGATVGPGGVVCVEGAVT